MNSLTLSVKQTLSYAAHFDYDLTFLDLHHWLISPKTVSLSSLKRNLLALKQSPTLSKKRLRRQTLTQQKLTSSSLVLSFFRLIPTIRLLALTGSLAMNNAKPGDDIDLMVITSPHSLWLTRLFLIPLLRLFFKTRYPKAPVGESTTKDAICLNLWLQTTSLAVPKFKRNLYTAHEVLQIRPLVDKDTTYQQFLRKNSWVKAYLANAYQAKVKPTSTLPLTSLVDYFLAPFNLLAFLLQYLYMRSKITHEYITYTSAYFHPRSHNPLT